MIFWLFIIIIAIVILALLWWYSVPSSPSVPQDPKESKEANHPTIHARCRENSTCGGDLVCDTNCRRCKKKEGGACAIDVDCESGLQCRNWICAPTEVGAPISDSLKSSPNVEHNKQSDTKKVHWNDYNEIFYIDRK